MKTKVFYLYIILFFFLILLIISQSGCNQLGPFKRNNTHDPSGIDFKPTSPDSLYAFVHGDSVKLYWKDRSNYEQGYLIERKLSKNQAFQILHRLPPNSESYTDVINGKPFWIQYRVIPYVQAGDSIRGRSIQTPYLPFIHFNTVMPKLRELSETKTRISWPLLYNGKVRYIIKRLIKTKNKQGSYHEIVTFLDTVGEGTNSYVDSLALNSSINREYQVIPLSNGEKGPGSQIMTLMPAPVRPGNIELSKKGTEGDHITLNWKASSLCEGFYLEMRSEGGNWTKLDTFGPNVRSYNRTLADTSKSYSFRIRSITSDYSPVITISYDSTLILRKYRDINSISYFSKIALNHAEDIIYYVANRYLLVAWDWKQDKDLFSVHLPRRINVIDISPNDSMLLVATGSDYQAKGGLFVINAKSGITEKVLSKTRTYFTALSPNGQDYVTFPLSYLQIRNIDNDSLVNEIKLNGGYRDVAFDPEAPYIAVTTQISQLNIYNLKTKANVKVNCDWSMGCTGSVKYDSEGKFLFDGGQILNPINATVETTFHFRHSNSRAIIGPMDRIYATWHNTLYGKNGISIYKLNGSLWKDFETFNGNMGFIVASDTGKFVVTSTPTEIDVWSLGEQWHTVSN